MSKTFIDTNILVYAMDRGQPAKRDRCREMLQSLTREARGVVSTQVLQEFFVATTRKLGIAPLLAKSMVHAAAVLETVVVTPALIQSAIDISILSRLSFWDALIIASAESAHCSEIWTEDMSAGQIIRGVKVVNPLKP